MQNVAEWGESCFFGTYEPEYAACFLGKTNLVRRLRMRCRTGMALGGATNGRKNCLRAYHR